jgi:hypothetical protein
MMPKKCVSLILIVCLSASVGLSQSPVKVWEEPLTLPTYQLDPPGLSPMFYTHESYQGAQKKI